ncbi:hypothetical protein FZC76_02990 [Sutcliffiella horikoshii]|uniref:Septum formation initiator n=1 Tax=Sutcliffiella horikoshii TaxID=79883 RepID=A0A5D4T6I5_9BACI|nr:hypothetical protein [Sutcliffiella horikoshii]TYS70879.1 hypothetical protein FZC76_02990 [Sutcliffiella horikoshii]
MGSVKKLLLMYVAIMGLLYGMFSVLSYNSIQIKMEKLEVLEEQYLKKEAEGEVPYSFKQQYTKEYLEYDRLQNRLQTFWMKWVFDFPEFKQP